jgi:hypothetical protein
MATAAKKIATQRALIRTRRRAFIAGRGPRRKGLSVYPAHHGRSGGYWMAFQVKSWMVLNDSTGQGSKSCLTADGNELHAVMGHVIFALESRAPVHIFQRV